MTIHLVDVHGKGVQGGVHYIGRKSKDGRHLGSPLANPFSVEQVGVHALRLYRLHLVHALATEDAAIITELGHLGLLAREGDVTLGCWCCTRPAFIEGLAREEPERRCHGDIVATMLEHWGIRLATYHKPKAWAAWVARDCGPHPHAVLASAFGFAEVRWMAAITATELRGLREHEAARMLHVAELVAAGMPAWMQR